MKTFRSPDGIQWGIELGPPGASNAMIIFRHPDGRSSRLDRYNWINWPGGEATNVTARLAPRQVLDSLTDEVIQRLYHRSMPVSRSTPSTIQ